MIAIREMPMATTFVSIVVQSIILSCLVSRLAVSPIMSTRHAHLSLRKRIAMMPIATIWLWVAFLGSWCFVVAVDVLQHGSKLTDAGPCEASIFVCISLYCVSKAALYLFLTERAHVVRRRTRREDRLYWFNLALVLGIIVLWILCHIYRTVVRTEERCIISIARAVDIPFIVYDFLINMFLTFQFLMPIVNSASFKDKIRRFRRRGDDGRDGAAINLDYAHEMELQLYTLAKRSFIGGFLCTLVTIANGIQVALMWGKEDAWVCLTTCSGDVVLNCIILHFVTNGRQGTDESVQRAEHLDLASPQTSHSTLQETVSYIKKGQEPTISVREQYSLGDIHAV